MVKEKIIAVMLRPNYQYDPSLLPYIVKPIESGEYDCVLGSRILT